MTEASVQQQGRPVDASKVIDRLKSRIGELEGQLIVNQLAMEDMQQELDELTQRQGSDGDDSS